MLLHGQSDDDSRQRVDLIRQGLNDAFRQNHTGADHVLITLRPALGFLDAQFELLVENLLQVEADVTDGFGLQTIALRFHKYVAWKLIGNRGKILSRKISQNRDLRTV